MLAGIGGNHSNQLLPLLDFDLIRAHPKVFQGYSDMTVLHWAIASRAGLATFYGPALVPELGEFPRVLPDTDRYLRAAWFGEGAIAFEPAPSLDGRVPRLGHEGGPDPPRASCDRARAGSRFATGSRPARCSAAASRRSAGI